MDGKVFNCSDFVVFNDRLEETLIEAVHQESLANIRPFNKIYREVRMLELPRHLND